MNNVLSIKMVDGSRYNTTEPLTVTSDGNWITIRGDGKTVRLNPAHIVSITEVGDDE